MFLNSAPALASGREALAHFITHVHTAKGQFIQRQIAAKPKQAMPKAAGNIVRSQLPSTQIEQVLQGHFLFKRPGQFIWAITQPYEQTLQADGKNFYVYDQDLQQVTHRSLDEAINGSSAAILFGGGDLERSFTLRDEGIKDGIDWVMLQPKQQDSSFERIRIGFQRNTLCAMQLHDAFGNTTYLTFHHLRINPAIPAEQFTFKLPAGAELVES